MYLYLLQCCFHYYNYYKCRQRPEVFEVMFVCRKHNEGYYVHHVNSKICKQQNVKSCFSYLWLFHDFTFFFSLFTISPYSFLFLKVLYHPKYGSNIEKCTVETKNNYYMRRGLIPTLLLLQATWSLNNADALLPMLSLTLYLRLFPPVFFL